MESASLAFRFLRFGLAFCWWGGIAMLVLIPIFLIAALSLDGDSISEINYAGYASGVDTSQLSVFSKEGVEGTVAFENGTVIELSFPIESNADKWGVVVGVVLLSVGAVALFMFVIKQLREILKTVAEGDPFVESNAKRVRLIGLVLLFATFGQAIGEFAVYGYADAKFRTEGFDLDGHLGVNGVQLLAGLCVLVLSEVFRHGARMREEQSLTV